MRELYKNYYDDMHTAIDEYERVYGKYKTKKVAFRIAVWNFLYILQKEGKQKHYVQQNNSSVPRIAFRIAGGYGDYLLFANWLFYFLEKLGSEKKQIHIFYHIGSARTIFNYEITDVEFHDMRETPLVEENYHLVIDFCKVPQISYKNADILSVEKYPMFWRFVDECEKYEQANYFILKNRPLLDGMGSMKSVLKGVKRIQEGNLNGFLQITEEYKYPIKLDMDEQAYLHRLGITGKYITIHRGWDATMKGEHVKAWSLESCGDLVKRIKMQFPKYQIVVVGASRKQAPDTTGADVDLVERTSLEEMKVLLKNSFLHIDNEGGMVHLRHALHGGPSIVLFGPTSVELFGYSENINIRSEECDGWCEWISSEWQKTCVRSGGVSLCMKGISTDMVLDEVERFLCGEK